ncbi:hypothetical protein HDV57DRAFT_141902 [Trichoderma longibrachiatum]
MTPSSFRLQIQQIHGHRHRQAGADKDVLRACQRSPLRVPSLGRQYVGEALARFGSRVREKSHVKIEEIASPLSTSTQICCPPPQLPLTSSFAVVRLRGISYAPLLLNPLAKKVRTQELLPLGLRRCLCRGHGQWRVHRSSGRHDHPWPRWCLSTMICGIYKGDPEIYRSDDGLCSITLPELTTWTGSCCFSASQAQDANCWYCVETDHTLRICQPTRYGTMGLILPVVDGSNSIRSLLKSLGKL